MLLKFTLPKDKPEYKYSNNGYTIIVVKDGKVSDVKSKRLIKSLIEDGLAKKASLDDLNKANNNDDESDTDDDSGIEPEDLSTVTGDTDFDDEDEDIDDDDSIEPDNLTELHKIGPAGQAELNKLGIFTFQQCSDALADAEKRQAIIDIKGITEQDVARLEDQLVDLLEGE